MTYDFTNLSPADFEDMSRDLVGRELKMRFEGFALGPDGGVDGRHASAKGTTILQAKHYAGSAFAKLNAAMKKERSAIDRISPKPRRYILATSLPLTPKRKSVLSVALAPFLKRESDIYAHRDLNDLLRKFPEIEKSNIKLWLSGAAVLERVIRSAAYHFTAISRADIEAKVRVYAQNPSFMDARDALNEHHAVIISGPLA